MEKLISCLIRMQKGIKNGHIVVGAATLYDQKSVTPLLIIKFPPHPLLTGAQNPAHSNEISTDKHLEWAVKSSVTLNIALSQLSTFATSQFIKFLPD